MEGLVTFWLIFGHLSYSFLSNQICTLSVQPMMVTGKYGKFQRIQEKYFEKTLFLISVKSRHTMKNRQVIIICYK